MKWILPLIILAMPGCGTQKKISPAELNEIRLSVTVDSCIDLGKVITIGDESMPAYVGMTIQIRNVSGKDFRINLMGFYELADLVDKNGKSVRYLPQEMWRSPYFRSDSSSYLVRSGETRDIHLASAIFGNYAIERNMTYAARLHYTLFGRVRKEHSSFVFPGPALSEPFRFTTCP